MKTISLILARGGSKGIKRNNLIDLKGKPLLSHVVEIAKKSNVDEVWVSTEDEEIASVALTYGASVIRRPLELAGDTSTSEEALIHFTENIDYDIMVFIQATSPMVTCEDINKGIAMMKSGRYDSIFSVTEEHWIPRWTEDLQPVNWDPQNRPRRQDKEKTYIENGAFYITSREFLKKNNNRYGGTLGVVKMPLARSFQIDSLEDLRLIEKLL